MQRNFECTVCAEYFLPGSRDPKNLSCGHSFCVQCLIILHKGTIISCPKCRTQSSVPDNDVNKLPTNYGILEMLESVCAECRNHPHSERCNHCDQNLCSACKQAHVASIKVDTTANFDILRDLVKRLSDRINDEQSLRSIISRRDDTIAEMIKVKEKLIHEIQQQHERNVDKIKAVSQEDIEALIVQNEKTTRHLSEAKTLLDRVRYLGSAIDTPVANRCVDMIKQLKELDTHELQAKSVTFTWDRDALEKLISAMQLVIEVKSRAVPEGLCSPDYHKMSPSKIFSDHIVFPCDVCVCPRSHKIICTDFDNNKVYILSKTFDLLHVFGENMFDKPYGVVCDGENIFVTDSNNHRVCVTDLQGKMLREFGSEGSGKDDFNCPKGIALDNIGNIYVCDESNMRIKITNKFGKYVNEIRYGIFEKEMLDFIAVTDDLKLAVTVGSGKLYVLTPRGQNAWTINPISFPTVMNPNGVVFDRFGNLLITDYDGNRVVVMNKEQKIKCFIEIKHKSMKALNHPQGLTITKSNDLIVSDSFNSRLVMFSIK